MSVVFVYTHINTHTHPHTYTKMYTHTQTYIQTFTDRHTHTVDISGTEDGGGSYKTTTAWPTIDDSGLLDKRKIFIKNFFSFNVQGLIHKLILK